MNELQANNKKNEALKQLGIEPEPKKAKSKKGKIVVLNDWLYTKTEDGKIKINRLNLANYLMDQFHFTFTNFDEHGYWWHPEKKQWLPNADKHLKKVIPVILEKQVGVMDNATVSAVTTNIMTSKGVNESLTDPFIKNNPHLVVFDNGTYNLDTDKIEENRFDNYILQHHDYDLGELQAINTWDNWLQESLVDPNARKDENGRWKSEGDPNAPETFKAFIGWALAGTYQEFQHYMMIPGNGGEGKSTMLNLISDIFGTFNISNVDFENLGDGDKARFQVAKMYRKELNYADDIEDGYIGQTNILKRLTGGNRLTAEYKGKDPFEFTNEAKLIFTCNHLPSFRDSSHGMARRPIIIRWRKIKDFKKRYLKSNFDRDKPAFVRECLIAYAKALKAAEDMEEPHLPMTEFMLQQAEDWIKTNDIIGNWIADNCETGEDPKVYHEQTQTLYNNYLTYCRQSGVQNLNKTNFNKELKNRGIEPNKNVRINGQQHKCYVGIRRVVKYGDDLH